MKDLPQRAGSSKKGVKQEQVVKLLRQQIITRKLLPGTQLPTHTALAARLRVSTVTIQLALTRLTQEGLVRAKSGHGTYVVDQLPHLRNYGLVFWNDPALPQNWSKFYAALTNEALAIQQREGRQFQFFHGIDGRTDSADWQRLQNYLQAHRLAGLILLNAWTQVAASTLLEAHEVPCVALASEQIHPRIPVVGFDAQMFIKKAVAHLAHQARKRIAYLGNGIAPEIHEALGRAAVEHGVTCPVYWRQSANQYDLKTANPCVQLLLQGEKTARPDGLIIGDDNLVEHAQAGIVAAGVRVPADLEVVAHCNFPWPPASVLPVQHLGFDIQQALRLCVELIDRQRRGESVNGQTTLPAQFESGLVRTPEQTILVPTQPKRETRTEGILQEQ